jgi:hypothetical protein
MHVHASAWVHEVHRYVSTSVRPLIAVKIVTPAVYHTTPATKEHHVEDSTAGAYDSGQLLARGQQCNAACYLRARFQVPQAQCGVHFTQCLNDDIVY